jgi:hypothetical protein
MKPSMHAGLRAVLLALLQRVGSQREDRGRTAAPPRASATAVATTARRCSANSDSSGSSGFDPAYGPGRLEPVHERHVDIHQNAVKGLADNARGLDGLDRLVAVDGVNHLERHAQLA